MWMSQNMPPASVKPDQSYLKLVGEPIWSKKDDQKYAF